MLPGAPGTHLLHIDHRVAVGARSLEKLENGVGGADGHARTWLHAEGGDHTVVDDHGVALGAGAEAEAAPVHLQPDGPGELTVPVGQHHHCVTHLLVLAPGVHDEGVVDRDARHGVDALGLQLILTDDVAGQVVVRAGRGEGTRDGEQHHLARSEDLAGLDVGRPIGAGGHHLDIGELVADGNCHDGSPCPPVRPLGGVTGWGGRVSSIRRCRGWPTRSDGHQGMKGAPSSGPGPPESSMETAILRCTMTNRTAPTTKAAAEPTSRPSSEATTSGGSWAKACSATSSGTVKPIPATAAPPATWLHSTPAGRRPSPSRTTTKHAR